MPQRPQEAGGQDEGTDERDGQRDHGQSYVRLGQLSGVAREFDRAADRRDDGRRDDPREGVVREVRGPRRPQPERGHHPHHHQRGQHRADGLHPAVTGHCGTGGGRRAHPAHAKQRLAGAPAGWSVRVGLREVRNLGTEWDRAQ